MRFNTDEYTYVTQQNESEHPAIQYHFACVSCLAHYPILEDLKKHINDAHPNQQSTSTRKRPCPDDEDDVPPILNSKNTLFKFASPVQSSQSLEASRMDVKHIESLQQLITVVTTYNPILSKDLTEELRDEKIAHAALSTLEQFTSAHAMIMEAVDKPIECLPSWLWSYAVSDTTSALEMKLIQAIRFILTDFVNICSNSLTAPFCEISERTFLIHHVVPIFKSLGNRTDMLCFNWCESQMRQHKNQARVMMNIGQLDEMNLRFVDGLGYDKNGDERIILEVSGGYGSNDHQHACDDTLKIVHSLMCILKGDAQANPNASLGTYKQIKAFGIQTVKTTMILSEMYLGGDMKYRYKEVMTAVIPIRYHERVKWLPVINLLAYLMSELDTQSKYIQQLQEEQNGKVQVNPVDTIHMALFK